MRTRAVAISSEQSNAVGALDLECTSEGLVITHRGVSSFQDGYAPGAPTTGTRVVVPWGSVLAARLEDNRLFLELDARITPHHRLLLSAFSQGDPPDPIEVRRRHILIRVGTAASSIVVAALIATTAARVTSESGIGIALLLGCLGAGIVLAVGLAADERLSVFGRASDAARLSFVSELSLRFPGLVTQVPSKRFRRLELSPPDWSFQALLPRSTAAIVITLTAALIALVLTASWVSRTPPQVASRSEPPARINPPHDPESRRTEATSNLDIRAVTTAEPTPVTGAGSLTVTSAAAVPSPSAEAARIPATSESALLAGACTCRRSDSLLWRDGLPKLSMVLIDKQKKIHHGHEHLELELAVVNNSDAPVAEVSLLVEFYEKDPAPSTKRAHTFDRPVYFEGPFAPAQAIKWHVEARGNDFEVVGLPTAKLDPSGTDAAPTNLLADLLKANHRPVRLHGAMMLAYLGDPRAKDGALGLREALREDEAPYLDRLLWALSPIRTCEVQVPETAGPRAVKACIWNGTSEPQKGLALRVRSLDGPFRHTTPVEAPPLVIAEKTWPLTGELTPNQGSYASVLFDPTNPDGAQSASIEAHADRAELVY